MGRTGSIAKVAREGAFSTACVGFCAATRTGFSALVRTDSVRSFRVFLEIDGAVFAVITWTTSFLTSPLWLSPPNVGGARPCARAPALKVTETNAVASAKKSRRLRTSARYAGNHNPWQAFFSIKTIGSWSLTGVAVSVRSQSVSIAREVIGLKSGRRTEHLVAVNVRPVPMAGHRFFAVWRDDGSAPRRQTQDQSAIGRDTRNATAHRMSAASRGICGRTPAGGGAFGC